ncbi:MAG: hypothetical protein ACI934_000518 [Pseudohongiellaceae bacterium]|jgi:hypothetical protein
MRIQEHDPEQIIYKCAHLNPVVFNQGDIS